MKHPGFKKVQSSIASKQGVSHAAAGRILGYAKAHASASAKKKNPHLLNTAHGKMHGGGVVPADVQASGRSHAAAHSMIENETQKHDFAGEPGHVQIGVDHRGTSKSAVAERHVMGGQHGAPTMNKG